MVRRILCRMAVLVGIVSLSSQCAAAPDCQLVPGELNAWNGTPSLRLQQGGQTYGVVDSPDHPLPVVIADNVNFDHSVTGDFTLCRLGQAMPGGMIYVWIKSVTNPKIVPAP
jgi:hypothetical protein